MTARSIILALGLVGVGAVSAPALLNTRASLIWNVTASAPEGLYSLQRRGGFRVGEMVAVDPPTPLGEWLAQRGALPKGVLLIKRVAAVSPSTVCWSDAGVRLDGRLIAQVHSQDTSRRALPVLTGCRRLEDHQVFLLNDAPGSLDGRYFGPLPRSAVVGRVTPIWIVASPAHGD